MHLHFLLHFLFFVPSLSQFPSSSDLHSLLEFKKGITSDASNLVLSSWILPPAGTTSFPNSFYGVSFDPSSGAVVGIALLNLGLSGDLKLSTLSAMKSLQNLILAENSFTGRLPPVLGSLSSLQHLDLSRNRFSGKIPGRIADLSGLSYLNLSSNGFDGEFPVGIRNLQQLRALDLSSNRLRGEIGEVLSDLRNLEFVDLSGNEFYDGLEMDAGNLSSLGNTVRHLNLSTNMLDGGFFSGDSMQLFRNLEVLDVGDNRLTGELPKFDFLTNLRVLRAGNNLLFGSVPEELFGSRMPLVELDLSGNGFTGHIRTINSTTLKVLNLSSNALSGSLSSNLGSCISVDLSRNMLSGDLYAMQNWGDTLETIDFSSNALSGNFPNETSQFGSLTSIKMRNNSLVGFLPSVLGRYPMLATVDLSLNKFSGPILPTLISSLTLTSLNLSGNHFTGPIPLQSPLSTESLVLPSYTHLESLDLSDNQLSGSLPPEISSMQRLKFLNVGKNTLSGELPSEISNLGGLELLDLSNNHFKGRIPDLLQQGLKLFNVSYNDLSGIVPQSLRRFPITSFHPGNAFLFFPDATISGDNNTGIINKVGQHRSPSSIQVALIVGSIGAVMLIFFVLVAFYKLRSHELCGRNGFRGQTSVTDVKLGIFSRPNKFKSQEKDSVQISMSFSNDHLLRSASRSVSAHEGIANEAVECSYSNPKAEAMLPDPLDHFPPDTGSLLSPSTYFVDSLIPEQPVMLDVCSQDRLAGKLYFLDSSLVFTTEELSRAPAEVLDRSSHGTSYKVVLDSGHMLTVKWLRVGLVKHKKEFAKEAKRIGTIRHPNIISWRGYYWGPWEQERLIVADYVNGDSLALHLYGPTPRRYSRLSAGQRLKIAIEVAQCLYHLHHQGALPHGNLKSTNILLTGPELTARVTDFGLHRLMTPGGNAAQLLTLGALGYRAPELAAKRKPLPSFKGDVYAFGVILMELITGKRAGDIITGRVGSVDLTDWVRKCAREERGVQCFDENIAGLEEAPRAIEELLVVSLRCTQPVDERPDIRTVLEELCSITL